jgi:transposase
MSYAVGEMMAKYKRYDYAQLVMIPISLERPLMPGTLEFAIHELVQRRMDTSICDRIYRNAETGCPAYDPKILLKVILLAYARGIISSRKIEQACRENIIFMAPACGMLPDHSTIAAFVSSMNEEIKSIFSDILLIWAEQNLSGGPHFSLDGLKLSSTASKEWSGRVADLRQKQEKFTEKVKRLLEEHETADKAGEGSGAEERLSEPDKVHEQIKRLERQTARIEAFFAVNDPKRGKRGKELQSNVTDHESATMQTAQGGIQGYNGQALVDAKHQVIVHAEACGNGQDYGHVAPMVEGAKANLQAIGLPQAYLEGTILSADSHYPSETHLQQCAQAKLDASIPAPHFRQRDPRLATQDRHKLPTEEKGTLADFTYDNAQECDICPQGNVLKLEARRHQIGNHIYRRDEASEAECTACPLRELCVQTAESRRNHLAVWVEKAKGTLSQQMIAKIDPPEARKMYGLRLAMVEPVFGDIRSQKRLDRFTWRGKIKVNIQWRLYCMVHNIEKIVTYGLAV